MVRSALGPVALALLLSACRCGDEPSASGDWKTLFDTLIKGLPEARTEVPLEVIPSDVAWIASSPDPEAWRAWAAATPTGQAWMATPLFEDILTSRSYLAIDGMRRSVARASAMGGDPDDANALWRGPTALATEDPGAVEPTFVVVKRIDPSLRSIVRLAAAFAQTKDATLTHVESIDVRTVSMSGRSVSFALFKNLLIAGTDQTLVERAAALAQRAPKGEDKPASADPLLPPAETPGIHARILLSKTGLGELTPIEGIGFSLIADARAPLKLRRTGVAPAADLSGILAYAPASTTLAWIDAAPPSALLLDAFTRFADNLGDPPALKKKQKALATFDATKLVEALTPGFGLVLGVRDDATQAAALGPIVVMRHSGLAAIEPQALGLIERLSGEKATRTVLEDRGNAVVYSAKAGGVTAGITADALVIGLDADAVGRAIAAGQGRAPSVKDRVGAGASMSGGVFIDGPKTGAWLDAFYAEALEGEDTHAVLGPTFAVLAKAPALFARLVPSGEIAEGPLEALP